MLRFNSTALNRRPPLFEHWRIAHAADYGELSTHLPQLEEHRG